MCTFTSTGTVKVKWPLEGNGNAEVYFIPDRNHSIRCGGRCYAVFVEHDSTSKCRPKSLIRALDSERDSNNIRGVRLKLLNKRVLARICGFLAHAAMAQCKVELGIKEDSKNDLVLENITVPAP